MAVIFPSTNRGSPWQPGEKDPACLAEFSAEIQRCIAHYEIEGAKCVSGGDGPSASAGGSPTDGSGSATERSVFDGTWLVTDKNVSGYTITFICTLTTSGSSIEERCDGVAIRTGVVRGQVAKIGPGDTGSGSVLELRVVDQNTLEYQYPYGSGTYKRQ